MSLGFCLVTTKTWSDDSKDPLGVSQPCHSFQASNGPCYSSQTNRCYSSVFQLCFIWMIAGNSIFEVNGHVNQRRKEKSAPARGGERERERERDRAQECAHAWGWERARAPFGSSFYMVFFLPPRPALCKLGLVRSALLPEVLTLSSDLPLTFFCSIFLAFPFLGF